MNIYFKVLTLLAVVALYSCASVQAGSAAQTPQGKADQAIAMAEKELAAAQKAGHVWRLIDKSTGGKSQNLAKLLDAAKKARDKGDMNEAIRIAERVASAAKLGQQQAAEQADAKPVF